MSPSFLIRNSVPKLRCNASRSSSIIESVIANGGARHRSQGRLLILAADSWDDAKRVLVVVPWKYLSPFMLVFLPHILNFNIIYVYTRSFIAARLLGPYTLQRPTPPALMLIAVGAPNIGNFNRQVQIGLVVDVTSVVLAVVLLLVVKLAQFAFELPTVHVLSVL